MKLIGENDMTEPIEFPKLFIEANGASGIEIRTILKKKYDCVEFTLRDDVPQAVFISPWMQFEPVELADERLKLAYEIARRATMYDTLLKEVKHLQEMNELTQTYLDKKQRTLDTAFSMWKADREKMGFPADFSDIKEWPPEMMCDY